MTFCWAFEMKPFISRLSFCLFFFPPGPDKIIFFIFQSFHKKSPKMSQFVSWKKCKFKQIMQIHDNHLGAFIKNVNDSALGFLFFLIHLQNQWHFEYSCQRRAWSPKAQTWQQRCKIFYSFTAKIREVPMIKKIKKVTLSIKIPNDLMGGGVLLSP